MYFKKAKLVSMCPMPALAQAVTTDLNRFVACELLETLRPKREAITTG